MGNGDTIFTKCFVHIVNNTREKSENNREIFTVREKTSVGLEV